MKSLSHPIPKSNIKKTYSVDTIITFGKHKGKSIQEIVSIDNGYINWCILKLEHFYINNENINKLKQIHPSFNLSDNEKKILSSKSKLMEIVKQNTNNYNEENTNNQKNSYKKYNNAYGFDDNTIDNAFEGDPENYWNID